MFKHYPSQFISVFLLLIFVVPSSVSEYRHDSVKQVSGTVSDDLSTMIQARQVDDNEALKKYQLQRLQELNKISAFIRNELDKLREASNKLAAGERADEEGDDKKVSIDVRIPSLGGLDRNGKVIVIKKFSCQNCDRNSQGSLSEPMKLLEGIMEELRNEKEMITSHYKQKDNDNSD